MRKASALLAALAVSIVVAAPTVAGAGTAAPDGEPSTVEQLFVQTAGSGRLKPVKGDTGAYRLTLRDVARRVTSFTDRPLRSTAPLAVGDFVDLWDGGPFATDPPNAALVIDDAPERRDTFVFELTDPTYDADTDTLTYAVTRIEDGASGRLAGFADQVDARPPRTFGGASLFVDPLPETSMKVTISGIVVNGGFNISSGYMDVYETGALQGAIGNALEGYRTVNFIASPSEGSLTVELDAVFCVAEGETTTSVQVVQGSSDDRIEAVFELDGVGAQSFTSSGTLEVPSSYQSASCPGT